MNLSIILLNFTINCLEISSLHPVKEGCMIMDEDRKHKIANISCHKISTSCNELFIKKFQIMCSGKDCKGKTPKKSPFSSKKTKK